MFIIKKHVTILKKQPIQTKQLIKYEGDEIQYECIAGMIKDIPSSKYGYIMLDNDEVYPIEFYESFKSNEINVYYYPLPEAYFNSLTQLGNVYFYTSVIGKEIQVNEKTLLEIKDLVRGELI